ncbi:TM2 domain-containing protein [Micromonospora sp. NPDC049240]|uniref:TM2 domain-containing protein n=1 Tax=Micromonospora sp. NPDC049240 TaxID=3155151 RepID=UPI003410E18C
MDRAGRWRRHQPTGQTSVDIFPPVGCRRARNASGSLWCPLMTTPYQQHPYGVSDKSKVVAGILQILLGGFGIGRFYMGDTKTGVIQLVVTLVTCGFGAIWGLVDGILILVNGGVDGQGRPLRD